MLTDLVKPDMVVSVQSVDSFFAVASLYSAYFSVIKQQDIRLCLNELLKNGLATKTSVSLRYWDFFDRAVFCVRDEAGTLSLADTHVSLDEALAFVDDDQHNGFGYTLIRSLADTLTHRVDAGKSTECYVTFYKEVGLYE